MQKVVPFVQPETQALRPGAKRDAVASAIRTLNLETEGLAQLATELGGGLAEPFEEAVRHCHRHRQKRPCRPQDRGHVRVDGHARFLRASE